jgi:hypothetical protein
MVPESRDIAKALEQLSASPANDRAAQVLAIYQRVMRVYEPARRNYRAAVEAGAVPIGFASSTNA